MESNTKAGNLPAGNYPVYISYHAFKSDICSKLWKLIYRQSTLWQIIKV